MARKKAPLQAANNEAGRPDTHKQPRDPYRGRFAPSPTGPLHFGSLVAAIASFLDARSRDGEWLVRMEDLDPPREVPGAADDILRTLEGFGLHWDGAVVYQSRRAEAYQAARETLAEQGALYACACTRKEIQRTARPGPEGPIYPGTCREGPPAGRPARSLRVRVDGARLRYQDLLLGAFEEDLAAEVGDFIVRRADGLTAYQLAVVVDDAWQGVTHVVRGSDLLSSTGRQIHLQQLLGLPTPAYLHLPVATHADGTKLSKQTGAPPVDLARAPAWLVAALRFLGQEPPAELAGGHVGEILDWASANWARDRIPARATIELSPAVINGVRLD